WVRSQASRHAIPGSWPQLPASVAEPTTLPFADAAAREATAQQGRAQLKRANAQATISPVYRAANARVSPASSAVRLTARAPCPTWPSARSSTGRDSGDDV